MKLFTSVMNCLGLILSISVASAQSVAPVPDAFPDTGFSPAAENDACVTIAQQLLLYRTEYDIQDEKIDSKTREVMVLEGYLAFLMTLPVSETRTIAIQHAEWSISQLQSKIAALEAGLALIATWILELQDEWLFLGC